MREARLTSDLPEQYARLYQPETGKFETPLDEQGIADIDALFELAIYTYPDTLPDFSTSERNVHHVYWSWSFWRAQADQHAQPERSIIWSFRNSTPQLAYVPLELHRWIEQVMEPPPPPSLEVMDRRNAAWRAANKLLEGAVLLDRARSDYDTKKHTTRRVLGNVPGHTPLSKQHDFEAEEVPNREYWLSELNRRLDGWHLLADIVTTVPLEDRIIPEARLGAVRALKRRIKNGAIVPRVPEVIAA